MTARSFETAETLVHLAPPSSDSGRQPSTLDQARTGKVRLSRHGAHWFDRVTGINVLVDEVVIPRRLFARAPRYVSIALTNACDLRCGYCYAPKSTDQLRADALVRWIEELDAEGCLGIGFGGGEPTIHRDFAGLCTHTAACTGLAVTFTTHGHRLDERLADAIRGRVHFIRVSVDGVGTTYERLRGRSFTELREHLGIVASVCPFGLNVVVNADTVDQLDAVVQLAEGTGASEVLLLPQQPTTGCAGIGADTERALLRWIDSASTSVRLTISRAGVGGLVALADPFPGEPALDAHAHIDATGTIRPDAYSSVGVPIRRSVLEALDELRAKMAT